MSSPTQVSSSSQHSRSLRRAVTLGTVRCHLGLRGLMTVGALIYGAYVGRLAAAGAASVSAPSAPESFARCSVCHGSDATGNESLQAPNLAGREAWYLRRQLRAFKTFARGQTNDVERGYLAPEARTQQMHPVVEDLSGGEQRRLVRFLSRLEPPAQRGAAIGDAQQGKALYAACVPCHGTHAEGKRWRGAPALRTVQAWYLVNQLRDFRMGWRGADSKNVHVRLMRSQLDLDDARLKDLASHIVSIP